MRIDPRRLGQALAIAITLIALARGARAQPPTPIEIPWDALVVEEAFIPGTENREVEPVTLRLNLEPGMSVRKVQRMTGRERPGSDEIGIALNITQETVQRIDALTPEGRFCVTETTSIHRQDYSRWGQWRTGVTDQPPPPRSLTLDAHGRILNLQGSWPPEEGDFDRLMDTLGACSHAPLPRQAVRPGDTWTRRARFEGIDGIVAQMQGIYLGLDPEADRPIARIHFIAEVTITTPILSWRGRMWREDRVAILTEMRDLWDETLRFDIEAGQMIDAEGSNERQSQFELTAQRAGVTVVVEDTSSHRQADYTEQFEVMSGTGE